VGYLLSESRLPKLLKMLRKADKEWRDWNMSERV